MNYQDLSDFFDMLQNPAKATALLDNIKEQTKQLNDASAVYGSVKDIESAQIQNRAILAKTKERSDALESKATKAFEKRQAEYDAQFAAMQEKVTKLNQDLQAVAVREATLKEQVASSVERAKVLAAGEEKNRVEAEKLATLIEEYTAKIEKLKSVMV
jgi:predicted  nucleic acid-binding Zn-ribbon protein